MDPTQRPHQKPHPLDVAREAVKLRLEGRTYKDIGRRLGISPETARRYVQALGMFKNQPDVIVGDDAKLRPSRYIRTK